jgi:hypothetical protein
LVIKKLQSLQNLKNNENNENNEKEEKNSKTNVYICKKCDKNINLIRKNRMKSILDGFKCRNNNCKNYYHKSCLDIDEETGYLILTCDNSKFDIECSQKVFILN